MLQYVFPPWDSRLESYDDYLKRLKLGLEALLDQHYCLSKNGHHLTNIAERIVKGHRREQRDQFREGLQSNIFPGLWLGH